MDRGSLRALNSKYHSLSTLSPLQYSSQHVVLLDWDDTVMPTTYLDTHFIWDIDSVTKTVLSLHLKDGSKSKGDEICRGLQVAGSAAMRLLKALYLHFVDNMNGRRLIIVTNGATGWLWNSLTIAGTLCPIWRQIEHLLRAQNTQILYARTFGVGLNHNYWKMACFDSILCRVLDQQRCHRLNIITIGDQWTDHCSIELTTTFKRHHGAISHHQLKLYPAATARYLGVELNYIADLFGSDQSALAQFAVNDDDGILIEFDGYHSVSEEKSDSDSPRSVGSLR